ncbi:helix-turn-helix domain-containing protein [Aerosakkonema sp. BLCC-F183]|uniref:helix-turn-helix domain-containing protein n=1 Tax=Aerosakkonema sp. BLCC-F183 TaxID=3342834 RepID=UPI0035BB867C
MLKQKLSLESVIQPEEVDAIAKLSQILSLETSQIKLVGSNGEELLISESVRSMLRQVVRAIADGKTITLTPSNCELTTQEAADILNISRPFLIKLLEEEQIPYIKVGKHRRIRYEDLMKYKKQRDEKRDKMLTQLIQMSQEAGFYE